MILIFYAFVCIPSIYKIIRYHIIMLSKTPQALFINNTIDHVDLDLSHIIGRDGHPDQSYV